MWWYSFSPARCRRLRDFSGNFIIRIGEMRTSLRIGSMVNIVGRLVIIDSIILLLPMLVSLIYAESDWLTFLIAAAAAAVCGSVAILCTRHHRDTIRAREGFIITAFIWVVFGLFGIIPLMTCSHPLGFTDAMFEIISGYTTTGASVIPDVGVMSHGILFWRALSQWIGGLGIILFMLALLSELNKSVGISMFNAEATGITHDKLHPRIRQTAISLWGVYVVLTLASVLALWAGPMDLFNSVCITFAAIATGGFSTSSEGVMLWHSDYVLCVLTVVMFVAGLNFMAIFNLWKGDVRGFFRNTVVRVFAGIILLAYVTLLLSALVRGEAHGVDELLVYPMFHVVSAITSTGFSVAGSEAWGPYALALTIVLMTCGACAGSTTGGLKVDRLVVLWQNLKNEVRVTAFPKRMYVVRLYGSALDNSLVSRVAAFTSIYLLLTALGTAVITFFGYSFTDSLFMVSSCIGCNGLGYGVTGEGGSFALLPDAVKWLLTALMLAGRLEIFTYLVLFLPSFWRR